MTTYFSRSETKREVARSLLSLGDLGMSNGRIFFAGGVTTVLLLGTGFSGGLMLAKTAMEPLPQNRITAADRLPPVRVILPPSAQPVSAPTPEAAAPPSPSPQSEARPQVVPANVEVQSQPSEKDKQADRAEQRKAEVVERERRRRYAERKAARAKQQQEDRQEQQRGMMAFSISDEQSRSRGFFGN
jgi:type IV secretory pathway VirB10-like protein